MRRAHCLSLLFCIVFLQISAQDQKIDSLIRLLPTLQDTNQVNVLIKLATAHRFIDRAQMLKYAERALKQSREINYKKGVMLGYQKIGTALKDSDEYSQALVNYTNALEIAIEIENWLIAAQIADGVSNVHVYLSDLDEALAYQKDAYRYSLKSRSREQVALMLSGVGYTFQIRREYDSAVHYLKKSQDAFYQLGDLKGLAMQNILLGKTYDELGQLTESLSYYDAALDIYKTLKNSIGQGLILNYKAAIYLKQNRYPEAITLLQEARQLNDESFMKFHLIETLNMVGQAFQHVKNYDSAKANFTRLIRIATASGKRRELSEAYHSLAEVSASQNDFKNAYYYHELHTRYYDSIFSEEKNKQVNELQMRLTREAQERVVSSLKHEKFLGQVYLVVAIFVALALGVIGYLIIVRQRIQAQKNKLLAEKEMLIMEEQQSVTEAELRNKQLSEEQLRNQLDFKNKELTTYTLNLIHKNETLEDIKAQVEGIRRSPEAEIAPRLNSLLKAVNYSIQLDKDWENFKRYFEQVHQQFFDRLKSSYPDLSFNDLKLCSLVKLNLETKQIATLLDISAESAKVARSRLRKKLGLSTEQNLQEFLGGF